MLVPIQYRGTTYPSHIVPKIKEVAGNFDVRFIQRAKPYSLHTEYSYSSRKFDKCHVNTLRTICSSHFNGIPELWKSQKWAEEFVTFIENITLNYVPHKNNNLKIIEIHPPFENYSDIDYFLDIYTIFEKECLKLWPDIEILIENRSGTLYKWGKFIITKVEDIKNLALKIESRKLKLKIILDFPQLFTAHFGSKQFTKEDLYSIFKHLMQVREHIKSIHIWGKKINSSGRRIAHQGDLNDLFWNNNILKSTFLEETYAMCDDSIDRYFVPELNSNKDNSLDSIIKDFEEMGITFK